MYESYLINSRDARTLRFFFPQNNDTPQANLIKCTRIDVNSRDFWLLQLENRCDKVVCMYKGYICDSFNFTSFVYTRV